MKSEVTEGDKCHNLRSRLISCFSVLFSIVITSLGEERASLCGEERASLCGEERASIGGEERASLCGEERASLCAFRAFVCLFCNCTR